MKPINIFDIEDYLLSYQPLIEFILNDPAHSSLCAHYTSSKMPIEYASANYPFANLPQKNSCFSLDRLAQVDKNKVWNCPESHQTSCSYYRLDVDKIFDLSFSDSADRKSSYALVRNRRMNGYMYYIYSITDKSLKQSFTIPYDQQDLDQKAVSIFEEYISQIYNSDVSSFQINNDFASKEEETLVSEKQKNKSFLLSLVSVD